jgi:hypothetical protein
MTVSSVKSNTQIPYDATEVTLVCKTGNFEEPG